MCKFHHLNCGRMMMMMMGRVRDRNSLNVMYSGVLYLMELLMVYPLSAAVVERLFSRMKLVKTPLRNQILTDNLPKQLMIGKESSLTLDDGELQAILDILVESNPNMRVGISVKAIN